MKPKDQYNQQQGGIDLNGIQRGGPSFESVYVQPSTFSYELTANYNITPNLSPHWLRVQSRSGAFGRGYDSGVIQIHNNSRGEDQRRNSPFCASLGDVRRGAHTCQNSLLDHRQCKLKRNSQSVDQNTYISSVMLICHYFT